MKKIRYINIIFIICFIIIIITPLFFVDKKGGGISKTENRFLATFPKLTDEFTGKYNINFLAGLKDWFNDNVGFREKCIEKKTLIDYKIFNEFNNNTVVRGKDDWLFLMNEGTISRIQNTDSLNKDQEFYYKNKYSEITKHFNKLGTEFMITVFPDKTEMYSEYVPKTILSIKDESLFDNMKSDFQNDDNFDLKVVDDELKKAKEERVIYSKAYDTSHWNNYGAFIGYESLMKQAQKHLPNLNILNKEDFNIEPYEKTVYVGDCKFTKETDYNFELKRERRSKSDKSFFEKIGYKSNDPWQSYNYFKNEDENLPKAIVVGDSYVWMFMLDNMAESFSELVFIHQMDLDNLNSIYAKVKPDIIIGAGLDNTMLALGSYNLPLENPKAEIVSENTPNEIIKGNKYDINITVKNTSNEVWDEKKKVRLCIWQEGIDYGYRVQIPENVEVKPNESYTFTLLGFQAPDKNTTYLEYQMVEEGITYFGEKKRNDILIK